MREFAQGLRTHCAGRGLLQSTALASALGLVCLWGDGAWAQQANSGAASASVDEIVVTANKREQKLQDVPAVVTAVTGTEMQEQHIQTSQDLLGFIPNFSTSTGSGRDQSDVVIRGVSSQDYNAGSSQAIGVYQDEIYFNSGVLSTEPFYDLERIEVLSGPQGTLWGHNTDGGAINVITQKPTQQFEAAGDVTYGLHDEFDVNGAVGGGITNDLAARLSFTHQERGDIVHNDYDGGGLGHFSDTGARLQLLWQPTEDLSVLTKIHGRWLAGDSIISYHYGLDGNGTDVNGFRAPSGFWTTNQNVINPIDNSDSHGISTTVNWKSDFATLTVLASYDKGRTEQRFDDDESPADEERSHYFQTAEQENLEARLTSNGDGPVTWIVGAAAFHDLQTEHLQLYSMDPDAYTEEYQYASAFNFQQTNQNYAGYGSATWHVAPEFTVIGGLRYTVELLQDHMYNYYYSVNPSAPESPQAGAFQGVMACQGVASSNCNGLTPVNNQESSRAPTGDLTLQYTPTKDSNIYVKVARGYRGGGFDQTASDQSALNPVKPEFVWDYETGTKFGVLDNRLQFDLSVFHYDFKDIQYFTYNGTVQALTSAPSATYNGGEASITYKPTRNLQFNASYAQTEAFLTGNFYTAGPDGNIYNTKGKRVPATPENTASIGATYIIPFDEDRLRLHTQWNYQGPSFFEVTQISDPAYQFLANKPYWMGNARITYEFGDGHYSLSGWVNNITNTHESVGSFSYSYLGMGGATHIDPITAGVTASANF